jgi:CRP-like cAMP-binding protein
VLEDLSRRPEHIAAHTDLIREGAAPDSIYLILTGWACRYKVLPDGKRQIMNYLIPGDLTRLIHGAPSEIGCTILTGKVDRISGMSSPPPSVLLGG